MFKLLPPPLQRESEAHQFLLDYIHLIPIDEVGIPEYHSELGRELGDLKDPNLIYPIGGGLYVHIYPDATDSRNYYIAIEPGMLFDSNDLMEELEDRLVDYVDELDDLDGAQMDRGAVLRGILKKACVVVKQGDLKQAQSKAREKNGSRLPVTRSQFECLRYRLVRDKEGMGALEPLIQDPYIEDISCSGTGCLFLEHKIFKGLKTNINFSSTEDLDAFVIQLSEKIGKPVTYRDPIIDAVLPDGSRINLVFGTDVSKRGSNFTIRKFSAEPLSMIQLVEFGGLTYEMAAYLSLCMLHGMNMFVAGETASGKTTLINAVTVFLNPTAKIVSIEDTPELQVPHPNWIREVVRGKSGEGEGGSVTMFDLLRAALRQRPNEIIIGEIRGEEGAVAFQAMQTGHACMATFHAASVEKLIQRLTGHPINIPKTYIDNLNVVLIQSSVRLPDGKEGRRVISINEIVGYDPPTDSFSYIEVFRWNPADDTFEFTGYMNSYLLEEVIALKRGLPPSRKREIYGELTRRANILRRLKDQGVTGFYELFQVISQAYREGVFR
ncbi:MAG: type II/IV secretion system ATPase subunit [Chloroflexi bacterium]|nr:type II/IV secretion system ATPase subunit [Chloroflexota bacterium]MCI0785501.1 type II/IV secretion system ATPase subunit [Chloroflexota bacterium]MCI0794163.1 type II/IV secretion system ATPase subunit [Chloroflexota bacterium]MCI0798668.1 type II/IV secretion system ATPase subunit [Chloroflexota bacterium]MCI0824993.1 type II/IV secretion system ATPase subunit [Chloroflexota bacterium]